ncbi:MAG: BON domain-containing protein [Bauldia sp.]
MGDKEIRADVLAELDWEPSVNAANIGVAVENGVVTLSGHVATYAQRFAAERAAKRVRGVRAVAEEIEVRPEMTHVTADDEIAKRAVNVLAWDVELPAGAVKVVVTKGWVTLSGEVEWPYMRTLAESRIRTLQGVTGLTNLIQVKARADAAEIRRRIVDTLKRNAEIDAKGIRVTLVDGKVTLEGKVHTWRDRDALETAVWAAPGVKAVDDRVLVG